MDRRAHWESVYRTKADADLSWFQERPTRSLELIRALEPRPRSAIDVGAGQSSLPGELLDLGITIVAALDVSQAAQERAKARLGERAAQVRWIVGDVASATPPALGTFELWHDRAVFHFLTDPDDRRRYAELAARSVAPGGHLLVATFAPEGPEKCSGLSVRRYDAGALAGEFTPAFELVTDDAETHRTPWGKPQPFTYALLRRHR
jgi:SAM-dependent methyltransferase